MLSLGGGVDRLPSWWRVYVIWPSPGPENAGLAVAAAKALHRMPAITAHQQRTAAREHINR